MTARKFWAVSALAAGCGLAAAAVLAQVPYVVLIPFTGNDLVMMGPKSSTQVYAYDGDFLTGHLSVRTTGPSIPGTPTVSGCGGGSPTVAGTDGSGLLTTGTSTTGCTVAFAQAYTNAPSCLIAWQTNLASMIATVSNGGFHLSQTSTSGNKLNYICMAAAGG